MQQRGGEAQAQMQRARRHLGRMESSPVHDVRPRHAMGVGETVSQEEEEVEAEMTVTCPASMQKLGTVEKKACE